MDPLASMCVFLVGSSSGSGSLVKVSSFKKVPMEWQLVFFVPSVRKSRSVTGGRTASSAVHFVYCIAFARELPGEDIKNVTQNTLQRCTQTH